MIQRGASTNIIENKPAVARSIRRTDKYTRKVSNADASAAARRAVGKSPVPRERKVILKDNARGLSQRERKEVAIKREVKTRPATKEELTKPKKIKTITTPPQRVVKIAEPRKVVKTKGVPLKNEKRQTVQGPKPKTLSGGTVSRPGKKIDADKFAKIKAEDIKDVVQRRMAKSKLDPKEKVTVTRPDGSTVQMTRAERDSLNTKLRNAGRNPENSFAKSREEVKSIKLERREQADIEAEKRGEELRAQMNKQHAESGKTHKYEMPGTRVGKTFRVNTKVENPMREPGNITEVEGRTIRGEKNQKGLSLQGKKPDLKLSPAARQRLITKRMNNYKLKKGK